MRELIHEEFYTVSGGRTYAEALGSNFSIVAGTLGMMTGAVLSCGGAFLLGKGFMESYPRPPRRSLALAGLAFTVAIPTITAASTVAMGYLGGTSGWLIGKVADRFDSEE